MLTFYNEIPVYYDPDDVPELVKAKFGALFDENHFETTVENIYDRINRAYVNEISDFIQNIKGLINSTKIYTKYQGTDKRLKKE